MAAGNRERTFLIMWDDELRPFIFNISDVDKYELFSAIATGERTSVVDLFKEQAHCSLHPYQNFQAAYFITTDNTTTKNDIHEIFVSDPEGSIEIIRRDGRLIFSHLENMYENRT